MNTAKVKHTLNDVQSTAEFDFSRLEQLDHASLQAEKRGSLGGSLK